MGPPRGPVLRFSFFACFRTLALYHSLPRWHDFAVVLGGQCGPVAVVFVSRSLGSLGLNIRVTFLSLCLWG